MTYSRFSTRGSLYGCYLVHLCKI
ncbi:hypothetical protein QIH97_gp24 [Enterobacter phage KNP3]|nr:hypothetical protein QIH97_gp24 [Enterobacter phage KNP3]